MEWVVSIYTTMQWQTTASSFERRSGTGYCGFLFSVHRSSTLGVSIAQCAVCKHEKKNPMSQKDFRVFIAEKLLLSEDMDGSDEDYEQHKASGLPKVSGKHVMVQYEDKKLHRCKLPSCNGKSTFYCEKCNVCLHPNCFKQYHETNSNVPHFKLPTRKWIL